MCVLLYLQMDEDNSFTESISVKSAAKMFGGQAVIRRIPTPSSKRRGPPPKVPPRTSSRKSSEGGGSVEAGSASTGCDDKENKGVVMNGSSGLDKVGICMSQTNDDLFDKPLVSLSEINGISECESYDNVQEPNNIPSYEQFINGASLIDNDNDVDVLEDIQVVDSTSKLLPGSSSGKKSSKDLTAMDYTVVGTISPLHAKAGQGDRDKEEMSFVLGHSNTSPMSPVSAVVSPVVVESGLKRCLSPQGDTRQKSPYPNSGSSKRAAPAVKTRQVAEVLPAVRSTKPKEVTKHVGIMCEGCNNCLLDLKRQALRLVYPENSAAGPTAVVSVHRLVSKRYENCCVSIFVKFM